MEQETTAIIFNRDELEKTIEKYDIPKEIVQLRTKDNNIRWLEFYGEEYDAEHLSGILDQSFGGEYMMDISNIGYRRSTSKQIAPFISLMAGNENVNLAMNIRQLERFEDIFQDSYKERVFYADEEIKAKYLKYEGI